MSLAWVTVGVIATGPGDAPAYFYFGPSDIKQDAVFAPGGELITWGVPIIVGAVFQALVLRRQGRQALWWVLPIPLFAAIIGLTDPDVFHVGGGMRHILFHAKDFALFAIFSSAIVGIGMIWLLQRAFRRSSNEDDGRQ